MSRYRKEVRGPEAPRDGGVKAEPEWEESGCEPPGAAAEFGKASLGEYSCEPPQK